MLVKTILLTGLLNGSVKPDTTLPAKPLMKQDIVATDTIKTKSRPEAKDPELYMTQQVTYVSEFIKRFNNQVTSDGKSVPDLSQNVPTRKEVVNQLFDRFSTAVTSPSSPLRAHKERFLQQVCEAGHPVRLTFLSDNLYASVRMQITYQGKEQPVDFYLKSVAEKQGHSWKLLDAQAPFLTGKTPGKPPKRAATDSLYIPLTDQETAFLNLYNHIRDQHNLVSIAINPDKPTPSLVVFNELVSKGQITPVHTNYPMVYLPMDKGWVIQLNFNNRKHENSGWLITDLYQLPGPDANRIPKPFVSYMNPTQIPK